MHNLTNIHNFFAGMVQNINVTTNQQKVSSSSEAKTKTFADKFFTALSFVTNAAQKIIPTTLFSDAQRVALNAEMAYVSSETELKKYIEYDNKGIKDLIKELPNSESPLNNLMLIKQTIIPNFSNSSFKEIYNKIIDKPTGQDKAPEELSTQDLRKIAEYLPDEEKRELKDLAKNLRDLQEKSLDHLENLVSTWQTSGNKTTNENLHREIDALQKLDNSLKFRTGQFFFFRNDIQETRNRIETIINNLRTLTNELPTKFQTNVRTESSFSKLPLDATKEVITQKIKSLPSFENFSNDCDKIMRDINTVFADKEHNPIAAFIEIKKSLLNMQSMKDTYELILPAQNENLKDLSSIEQRAAYLPVKEKEQLIKITSNLRQLRDNGLENLGTRIEKWQNPLTELPSSQQLEAIKSSLEELRDEKPNEEIVKKIKVYIPLLNNLKLVAKLTEQAI
jgi:hypothetical protein